MNDSTTTQKADTNKASRPLPKWLSDQKKRGPARSQPPVFQKDYTLILSLSITGIVMLLIVGIISLFIIKRKMR